MRLIPVLDLLGGTVVRGVAGERAKYRAVESRLAASAEPLTVARGFRDVLNLTELYIADLDAILERRPNLRVSRALAEEGFRLLVDCGVRTEADAEAAFAAGATAVVAGLETLPGPALLEALCRRFGAERVIFSLDLKGGRPLANGTWKDVSPELIAADAVDSGIRRMIVLDLSHVGMHGGLGTIAMCGDLRARFPQLELITGGGARDAADLRALAAASIDGALVATALHAGTITCEDVKSLESPRRSSTLLSSSPDPI
jgi:phosphoribosylformimino-5-aminoimidazole carboxamide ribotide isomerase